jgi:hypothetical protein
VCTNWNWKKLRHLQFYYSASDCRVFKKNSCSWCDPYALTCRAIELKLWNVKYTNLTQLTIFFGCFSKSTRLTPKNGIDILIVTRKILLHTNKGLLLRSPSHISSWWNRSNAWYGFCEWSKNSKAYIKKTDKLFFGYDIVPFENLPKCFNRSETVTFYLFPQPPKMWSKSVLCRKGKKIYCTT